MHSLSQKRFFAIRDGEDEIVLTMEEADAILAFMREQDLRLCKYMEYVPDDVLKAETDEYFGQHGQEED